MALTSDDRLGHHLRTSGSEQWVVGAVQKLAA